MIKLAKKSPINSNFKLGILGGGQLGKMLSIAAQSWDINTYILDSSDSFPAANSCTKFIEGDFKNYDDVYQFGRQVDVLTIEIETVNTDALRQLKKEGVIVYPDPNQLDIIKDKGLQKQFYQKNKLPTSSFTFYHSADAIHTALSNHQLTFPFVQKARRDGYDGRGVVVIKNEKELNKLLDVSSIVEPLVDIDKELGLVVARNQSGEIKTFSPVEMTFHPTANLVEFLICPARIDSKRMEEAIQLAEKTIQTFDLCGLLAVELFLTKNGELLINEVAPRPHNSGHHTIDNCYTSQFQQHIRAVLNWPLGSTQIKSPAVMVNLLGDKNFTGYAQYEGIEKCLSIEGANFHFYGKKITKPFRKMGHATLLSNQIDTAIKNAKFVQNNLKIKA